MSRPVLLDTSFLIDLENETRRREPGPATAFLPRLRGRRVVVSVVTIAELLEGAADEAVALSGLHRFNVQGVHMAHAQRYARLQRRAKQRLSDNDAWLVVTAGLLGADVVGADRRAFDRLGSRYLRYR